MYVAHIDESGVGEAVLVVGALVSTPDRWVLLADEWRAALGAYPPIGYFKFVEATSLENEFHGFTKKQRDERLKLLWSIVDKHVVRGDLVLIHTDAYRELFFGQLGKTHDSPLFTGYVYVMGMSALGLEDERAGKLDFVFDDMDDTQYLEIVNAHRTAKVRYQEIPRIGSRLGEEPIRRNDKTVLPLQAADLWAGMMRLAYSEQASTRNETKRLARDLLGLGTFPNRAVVWDYAKLLQLRQRARETAPLFGLFYETGKQRSKRLKSLRRSLLGG